MDNCCYSCLKDYAIQHYVIKHNVEKYYVESRNLYSKEVNELLAPLEGL